jgi:FkbM family methyltransferase
LIDEDYVCADVGANLGIKTLLLAQYVPNGRVIAIEAAPTVAKLLETNIGRSDMKNITIVKTAIGDADGTTRFVDASAYGHISARGGVEIPIQRLSTLVSDLNLSRLDFVKMDVEGYEFPILRNSIESLNKFRSVILLEFNSWCQVALSDVNPKEFFRMDFDEILACICGASKCDRRKIFKKVSARSSIGSVTLQYG